MALSKTTTHAHNTSVDTLIQPEEVEEIEMGINAAAMKLIIDRLTDLYPHPIDSSVREVVSNGIDATAKLPVNERLPLEIFSPTALNASFRVVDHGIGMSADDVRKIYSQYGGSTKTDDFTQLGAYGLGAKAPLAYCSEFQVTTSKDGITTIFTCSRKAMGNVTTIISSTRTGAPNGTEVVIPVKSRDLGEFRSSIDKFKKFAPDVAISIDGDLVQTEDKYQYFDDFLLDEESGTYGRVWINNDAAKEYFSSLSRNNFGYRGVGVKYVLSGWVYDIEHNYYDSTFIVELKPGVVDFSSSRDSVTRNERSSNLHERIVKHYTKMNDALFEKMLDYFRNLPANAAWNFMMELNLKPAGDTVIFTSGHSSKIAALTLADGSNPVNEFLNASKKNVFGVLDLNTDPRSYRFITGAHQAPTLQLAVKNANGRVGDVTAAVEAAVKDKEMTSFLYSVLATRTNQSFYYGSTKNRNIVVVTGSDSDFVDTVRKNRPLLSTEIFPNEFMVLATTVSKKEVALAEKILSVSVTTMTPADVMERIVEARAERRKNAVKRDVDTELYVRVLDATAFASNLDFKRVHSSFKNIRISEIIANNDVIIVGDSWNEAIMGAANAGTTLLGKTVYIVEPKVMRAGHFTLLLGYRDAFATQDFVPRCKAAETFASLQRRSARLFNEEIQALTEGQVMACVPNANLFYPEIWEALSLASVGSVYEDAFDAFTKIDYKFRETYLYSPSVNELLESTFGENLGKLILEVSNVLYNTVHSNGYAAAVYSTLVRNYQSSGDFYSSPRARMLLASVVPTFFEEVSETLDKIAAKKAKTI